MARELRPIRGRLRRLLRVVDSGLASSSIAVHSVPTGQSGEEIAKARAALVIGTFGQREGIDTQPRSGSKGLHRGRQPSGPSKYSRSNTQTSSGLLHLGSSAKAKLDAQGRAFELEQRRVAPRILATIVARAGDRARLAGDNEKLILLIINIEKLKRDPLHFCAQNRSESALGRAPSDRLNCAEFSRIFVLCTRATGPFGGYASPTRRGPARSPKDPRPGRPPTPKTTLHGRVEVDPPHRRRDA